jgi:hypothetical protein
MRGTVAKRLRKEASVMGGGSVKSATIRLIYKELKRIHVRGY